MTYYSKNKDKILSNLREPLFCDVCDINMVKSSYKIHCKTLKHQINQKRNNEGLPPLTIVKKPKKEKPPKVYFEVIKGPIKISFN